jgi:putative spermidine/putrescine transport system permease protein
MERVHRRLSSVGNLPLPLAGSGRTADRGRGEGGRRAVHLPTGVLTLLQITPLTFLLAAFVVLPLVAIVVVSFLDYDSVRILPNVVLTNYTDLLFSSVTWRTYLNTLRYAAIVWAITLVLGFFVAYVLAFVIRGALMQTILFLVCTIPFLTSNIIRMIAWVPFLGREGLANRALLATGLIDKPLEWLLFSDFAVILAFVHLYTLFMVVPIFNTMMRIDRSLIEAATDAGAGPFQVVRQVIIPLCKPGIAIGSVFVITLVMGDFATVRLMSGGQSASVGLMIANGIALLQYPAACANAVILLAIVLLLIGAILRAIDIRQEL